MTELEPDEIARVVQVNLLGVMYGSKVAAERMLQRGQGAIINVGSALSERAVPLQSVYVATKHGVAGFTEALRLELADCCWISMSFSSFRPPSTHRSSTPPGRSSA